MQVITSKDNEMVKNIKRLKEKKYRQREQAFIVEGIKLVQEAIQEQMVIKKVVICEDCTTDGSIDQSLLYEIAKQDCMYVSKNVFESLTDVVNPQGILAVIEKKNEESSIDYGEDMLIVLDGIQDPGNLGTILRTMDSAGLKQIILSETTADPYNPKVVRSTMGAIYRIHIIQASNILETLKNIQKNKFQVVATSLQTQENIYTIDYHKKAIVIGNEANGVSKEVLELANQKVKIPMLGKTESLNAAVATSVIIYEYVRRKIIE
ncbi:MAG: TrmH family RNA methyltransferase [Clostridia bacterium]